MIIIYLILMLVPTVLSEQKIQPEFHVDFQQNDYTLIPERLEVVRYNKDYVNRFQAATFKYNRTCTVFNVTINFNFDANELEVISQEYKFMSNEYRLFPLRMQYNVCKAVSQNFVGILQSSCGNFSGCPMSKGRTYHLCKWSLDGSKLPPLMPSGRYMLEFQFLYHSTEVGCMRFYSTITRPEV